MIVGLMLGWLHVHVRVLILFFALSSVKWIWFYVVYWNLCVCIYIRNYVGWLCMNDFCLWWVVFRFLQLSHFPILSWIYWKINELGYEFEALELNKLVKVNLNFLCLTRRGNMYKLVCVYSLSCLNIPKGCILYFWGSKKY